MNITINGNATTTDNKNLNDILMENNFPIDKKGIAVAVNETVITKSNWAETEINSGDTIEVVKPFQGG